MAKLPSDAVEYYFSLGPGRSYRHVAEHYGATKRAVTEKATHENWQRRMEERERKARERTDEKAIETLGAMNNRHLKSLRVIQRSSPSAQWWPCRLGQGV